MVQQIIDENGILTNVILSSQPPGIMAPPLMVGYYVSIALHYVTTTPRSSERLCILLLMMILPYLNLQNNFCTF